MKKWMGFLLCTFCIAFQGVNAREGNESTIAVLDLREYYNNETEADFIKKIREALHLDGFFALKNTGVNLDIINRCYESAAKFFALPMETKLLSDGTPASHQRGYTAMGSVAAKGSSTADFKEYYAIGRTTGAWDNIWPEKMDLQTPFVSYFNHMDGYARVLEEIFSKALGEEGDFITKISENGDSSARLIHYPFDQSNFDKESEWSREHTDIDTFTIIPRATAKGLEVCDRNGNWKAVHVNEDAFIINCGDFLEIFSNGYFLSAKHRVRKPKNMNKDRYSSVMFVHTENEAYLYPLQHWIDKVGQKRFIKATRLEMLLERLADLGISTKPMLKLLSETKVLERLMTVNRASIDAMKAVVNAGYGSDEVKAKLNELQ